MPASITIMMVFFSITTVAVFLFPIVRLTPSWLDRSLQEKIGFHRAAGEALAVALERAHNDPVQHERLSAQLAWHRQSLALLAPGSAPAATERRAAA